MWNVSPNRNQSRGGFQNADVGGTQFDDNYGPDYGIDYARFSDPPDFVRDLKLKSRIEEQLALIDEYRDATLMVRNGFVILKGNAPNETSRGEISEFVRSIPGVVEVINQVTVLTS